MQYLAYITKYEGTGRPNEQCVCAIEDSQTLRDVHPTVFHRGALVVGRFPTEDEAWQAVKTFWAEHTAADEDFNVLWNIESKEYKSE